VGLGMMNLKICHMIVLLCEKPTLQWRTIGELVLEMVMNEM
jgi:hypothetical protein